MGRGVAYPYEHYVLIDTSFHTDDGYSVSEFEWDCFNEDQWNTIDDVMLTRGGSVMNPDDARRALQGEWADFADYIGRFQGGRARLKYEFDRFIVGVEGSDNHFALFVIPLAYSKRSRTGHVYHEPYSVQRDADRLFNALHRALPGRLKISTSAWATRPYTLRGT